MRNKELILTPTAEHLDFNAITLKEHPENNSREFPDGEVYVQMKEIEKENVLVVHSGAPCPDKGLSYLYGVLSLLKQKELSVEVFFTYYPYSMQDKEFYDGTLNRAKAIIDKLFKYYNVEKIHCLDPHFSSENWIDEYELEFHSAFQFFREKSDSENVIGPDQGVKNRKDLQSLRKKRKGSSEVDVAGEVERGDSILIFDDIIETGGTICTAIEHIKEEFEKVEVAAVHPVMSGGIERVADKAEKLYLSNSVDSDFENIVKIEEIIENAIG